MVEWDIETDKYSTLCFMVQVHVQSLTEWMAIVPTYLSNYAPTCNIIHIIKSHFPYLSPLPWIWAKNHWIKSISYLLNLDSRFEMVIYFGHITGISIQFWQWEIIPNSFEKFMSTTSVLGKLDTYGEHKFALV